MTIEKHILDTAEDLFNHNGYTGVGVDLIRDSSGVSKTTIYKRFSDKDGLITATLNRRHQRFSHSLAEAVNNANGIDDKLIAFLNWHYKWFKSEDFDGCMFMHALSEFKGKNKNISNIAVNHKLWIRSLIESILKESASEYHSTKVDLIMNTIEGLIINAEFFKAPPPIKIFRHTLLYIAHLDVTTL